MLIKLPAALLAGLILGATARAESDLLSVLKKTEQEVDVALSRLKDNRLEKGEVDQVRASLQRSLQYLGTQQTFVGDSEGAMRSFDQVRIMRPTGNLLKKEDALRIEEAIAEDAIETIVSEAASHQVVILNEAHHVPAHRAFAMRLAKELRKIGYSWLACETFEREPMSKGYLADKDGYYSREPAFGNFVRDAFADGWKLVQYEPFDLEPSSTASFREQIEKREIGQAQNLISRIFANDPKAKVLIYVGYSHLKEKPFVGDAQGPVWMAAHLRHMTGLDPLTIDQATMIAHSDARAEFPAYAPVVERITRNTPFLLRSKGNGFEIFGSYQGAVDIQVIHPRYANDPISGRPIWMSSLAGLRPTMVPIAQQVSDRPRYIFAFRKGEPEDGVPVDVIFVRAGERAKPMMLPDGAFHFVERF